MPADRSESHDYFEALVTPQLESAYRFAFHLSRNEADAEDLLQEACHQAFQKFHQFERGTNFKAWLFRILRNRHIDNLRRKKNEPSLQEIRDHRGDGEVPLESPSSEEATWFFSSRGAIDKPEIFYDLFGDEVNRFLAEIPGEFRAALVLCDVDGFSYQEIGEIMGCPIGTVRSRISRARAQLKEKLFFYAKSLGYVRNAVS